MIKKWRGYDAIPSQVSLDAEVDVVATVGFDLDGPAITGGKLVSLAHFRTQGRDLAIRGEVTVEMRNMARLIRDMILYIVEPGQEAWLNKATLSVFKMTQDEFETMVKQYYKEGGWW
ncbi:hypothetical protein SPFM14_00060 [Salmonella phage SPFM14]|nr:hypothetical protein SPFM14_00060 [Salmonella phage SPFM14]